MIKLKVRTPKEVLSLELHESSTFEQLKIEIAEKLNLDGDFDVLAGFPLQPLSLSDDDLILGRVQNNEVLRIQAKELAGQQAQGHAKYRPSKRTKSSASAPAPASASDTLAKSATSSGALRRPRNEADSGFGARIATIHSTSISRANNSSSRVGRASGFSVFPPGGVRNGAEAKSRQRVRQVARSRNAPALASDSNKNGSSGTSESDISEHLLSAVSGGSSTRDKILRKVFRNAVEYQYSSSKAVARLQAVYAGSYSIQQNAQARNLGSGMSTQLDVTYPRGGGQRGVFTESVELLGEEVLRALMKVALDDTEGEGKEVLKPMNLARCSPRIFWSIVHRYGSNLTQGIRLLLKGIDDECSWLTERKRELSDKAKENEAQERQKIALRDIRKRKRDGDSVTDGSIAPVPDSNSSKSSTVATTAVSSVLERPLSKATTENSRVLSPRICEIFGSLSLSWCISDSELLHSAVKDFLSTQFPEYLAPAIEQAPWVFLLANVDNVAVLHQVITTQSVSEDQVELWIVSAQQFVLQHMWQVLCGSGSERLRLALAKLRVRTPLEMLIWKAAPNGLYSGLNQIDPGLSSIAFSWPSSVAAKVPLSTLWTNDHVSFMISLCQEMKIWCGHWLGDYDRIVIDDAVSESVEQKSKDKPERNEFEMVVDDNSVEEVSFEEWIRDANAHEYMSKRCRIVLCTDDEASEDDNIEDDIEAKDFNTKKGCVEGYWEDGTVIAYLPPTEEEPMALWRVQLDENPLCSLEGRDIKHARYEDLEENEVIAAMKLYSHN